MKNAYTETSIWRNRDNFFQGHDAIVDFLTKKWSKENGYRLRKELFAFQDNKVSGIGTSQFRPRFAELKLVSENISKSGYVSFPQDAMYIALWFNLWVQ